MSLKRRISVLAERSTAGEAARLRKHWERYAEKRAVVFKQFVDAVPEGSYKAVELALTPWVSELHNPQWWGPPEAPALARWVRGLEVGAFPVPLPSSLIELLLTHPADAQLLVGEDLTPCPRAGCGKSACPVR